MTLAKTLEIKLIELELLKGEITVLQDTDEVKNDEMIALALFDVFAAIDDAAFKLSSLF